MARPPRYTKKTEPTRRKASAQREAAVLTYRRPPAVEPSRSTHAAVPSPHTLPRPTADMPPIVLRLPAVQDAQAPSRRRIPLKLARLVRNKRLMLAVVAAGLVLLTLLFFSGGRKKATSPLAPNEDAPPAWSTPENLGHTPVPTWKEPTQQMSSVVPPSTTPLWIPSPGTPNNVAGTPPTPAMETMPPQESPVISPVGERYPQYRTADRGANLADEARRDSSPVPAVRFEGTIVKPNVETIYDRPRSSPY